VDSYLNLYRPNDRPHVSLSGALPQPLLLAESCQPSHAVDPCSAFVERRWLVPSFLRTVLRRGRLVLYTGFVGGEPWSQERVPGPYPFPFWASH